MILLRLAAIRHQSPQLVRSGIKRGANRLPNRRIAAEMKMVTIATPKAASRELLARVAVCQKTKEGRVNM
jgi:hypothetical protein